jgi:hypothetical protein
MAWTFYNRGKLRLVTSVWPVDLRMLVAAGASVPAGALNPDLNTVSELLAVSGFVEAAAAGYTRADLASVTVTENDASDKVTITWADFIWTTVPAGETWRGVAYYIEAATDALRELVGFDQPASVLSPNGGNITWTGSSIEL